MKKSSIFAFVFLLWVSEFYCGTNFRQERAQFKYLNPKYVKDATIFTGRRNRNEPYLTNLTGTILQSFDRNVSFSVILQLTNGHDFKLTFNTCEAFKSKWIVEFLKTYTDIPPKCPLPANTYHFFNMELPPRSMPIPIPSGDYDLELFCFVTDTKEKIFDARVFLHFEKKNSASGRKTKSIG